MTRLPRLTLTVAALALSTGAIAAKPCLTQPEVDGLIAFALPGLVEAVGQQCATALPPAALFAHPETLADRYRATSEAAWPVARTASVKMADPMVLKLLGDDAAKKLMSSAVAAGVAEKVKPKDCTTVDRVFTALEPLPPKNMAMLIGALLEIGSQGDAHPPFQICKAP